MKALHRYLVISDHRQSTHTSYLNILLKSVPLSVAVRSGMLIASPEFVNRQFVLSCRRFGLEGRVFYSQPDLCQLLFCCAFQHSRSCKRRALYSLCRARQHINPKFFKMFFQSGPVTPRGTGNSSAWKLSRPVFHAHDQPDDSAPGSPFQLPHHQRHAPAGGLQPEQESGFKAIGVNKKPPRGGFQIPLSAKN